MCRTLVAALLVALFACAEPWPEPQGVARGTLCGQAPQHCGGRLTVTDLPAGGWRESTSVAADGSYRIHVLDHGGDLLLQAEGGQPQAASNLPVDADGSADPDAPLQAVVFAMQPFSSRRQALTPWTHLVAQAAQQSGSATGAAVQDALLRTLSCGQPELQGLLQQAPALRPGAHGAALAYASLGGLAAMARKKGCSSAALVEAVAATAPWQARPSAPVPELFGQPLAQAVRRFVATQPPLPVSEAALRAWLHCLSADVAPLLGAAGTPLDVEPPQIELRPARAGRTLSGRRRLSCRACDPSGIAELRLEVVTSAGEPLASPLQQVQRHCPCALLEAQLDAASLPPGELHVRCLAVDRWGQQAQVTWEVLRPARR